MDNSSNKKELGYAIVVTAENVDQFAFKDITIEEFCEETGRIPLEKAEYLLSEAKRLGKLFGKNEIKLLLIHYCNAKDN